jgi:hypothetical protein
MLEAKFEGKNHILYVQCIFPENLTVYEITWSMVERQMTI